MSDYDFAKCLDILQEILTSVRENQENKNESENERASVYNNVSNCSFVVEDNKGEHLDILATTAEGLLNITKFFVSKQVKIESVVSVTNTGIEAPEAEQEGCYERE